MKTIVIVQPDNTVGEMLKELFTSQSPVYEKVWVVSAFVRPTAVQEYLAPYIEEVKTKGVEINVVVGIDLQSTTAEALREIISLGINAKVFHDTNPSRTFHPKIYLFESKEQAELLIGSNNLTKSGLSTNYEAATRTTYFFPEDESDYLAAKKSLERYLNPSGITVQLLTEELVEILVARGKIPTEKEAKEVRQQIQKENKTDKDIPKSPFGSEKSKRVEVDLSNKTIVEEVKILTRSPFRFTKENLDLHQTVNVKENLKRQQIFCNDGVNNYTLNPSGVKSRQARYFVNAVHKDLNANDGTTYTFVAIAHKNYPLVVVQYADGTINIYWTNKNELAQTICNNFSALKIGHI